ncbi:MAG TPA: aspartate aminotransferase family protein [Candidatus Bathyarchaeia archaeon]|nr:aspartate aminotransferase family protein [Candidatus Bathyarchaeia archaeon]
MPASEPRTLPVTRRYADPASAAARLHRQARSVMPGGNSRTSVFMAPYPPYAAEGLGCWVVDVDGDRRLDLLNNYTSLIHGHAHPAITAAASARLARGSAFALPTSEEVELAALLVERLPAVDQVRFANSGTEAVMMAIQGARGFTGRPKIAKFEGAYHGSYDYAEVSLSSSPENWGPLAEPASVPYAHGTPPAVLADVVVLPFNHPVMAVRLIERHARELAAVIVDPVPNRAGLMPASRELLESLRAVTAAHGIVLIFDEVISFRVGYHGAQGHFGVNPDLTTLAKIIGGGFPVGAVGGRAEVMAVFDPSGGTPKVPHAGTFNANPVTMAAGLAAMRLMDRAAFDRLAELGAKLRDSVAACFKDAGIPGSVTGVGSLFRLHPSDRTLVDYRSSRHEKAEAARLERIVRFLLDHGVMISTTGLGCLSTPMGDPEIEGFLDVLAAALRAERGA